MSLPDTVQVKSIAMICSLGFVLQTDSEQVFSGNVLAEASLFCGAHPTNNTEDLCRKSNQATFAYWSWLFCVIWIDSPRCLHPHSEANIQVWMNIEICTNINSNKTLAKWLITVVVQTLKVWGVWAALPAVLLISEKNLAGCHQLYWHRNPTLRLATNMADWLGEHGLWLADSLDGSPVDGNFPDVVGKEGGDDVTTGA